MADGGHVLQRVACKAVIAKDGRMLVLREAHTYNEGSQRGKYGLPGGRINPGEPFEHGLLREVIEETGLQITIGEPLFVGEWSPVIEGVKNHIVAIFFVCAALTDTVTVSDEHDEYQWVSLEEARKLVMMPPDDQVVEKYFNQLAGPAS